MVGMTPGERALRSGAATVAPPPGAVFRVTGREPLRFLHDVLTQDVASLGPGRGALAALLTDQGRVRAELRVLPLGEDVILDAEEAARPGIEEGIGRVALLAGCEVVDESGRWALVALRGPGAADQLAAAGLPVPPDSEGAFVQAGELLVVRVAWGLAGFDLLGEPGAVGRGAQLLAAEPATAAELEAARVEAGRPRFGVDVTEALLVNETPLIHRAVSFTKGCYPGQESVARVHNLGGVRRVLRALRIRRTDPVEPGTEVARGGAAVGALTSVAALPGDGVAAIALLRSEIEPETAVEVAGSPATVLALP